MLSIPSLRTRLRHTQIRLSRAWAAPDRLRRRRWAEKWNATRGQTGSADAFEAEGFAPWELDERSRTELLAAWHVLKATHAAAAGSRSTDVRTTGKAFFEEMLSDADLSAHPAFLRAALDERLLGSVMQAMGMVPHLESIDVLASTHTGTSLTASQLWHYDVNDERIVKLFVYLEDCGERNGPFTYIPADASQRVAHAVGHYVHDEFISAHVPRTQWKAVEGPAGTAFLIDTGRCYHFGSRSELTRVAYVVTYSSGLKFMRRSKMWGDVLGSRAGELSPLQQAVCGLGG